MSQLEDLLQRCTAKLSLPDRMGWGTGFFVAPEWILTCAHVVPKEGGEPVQVHWQQRNLEAVVERSLPEPYDLALLRVTLPTNVMPPCVYLDEVIQSRDPLYLFGYPDEGDRQGEPRTFNCDGITGSEIASILFNLGQVRPGMSGSPLLNQRTGKVCGIVKFTRDRTTDLGGGAIPTQVILEQFPQLRDLQQQFHQRDRHWFKLLPYTRCSWRQMAFISSGITAFVVLVRFLGLLQSLELAAYDQLIRLRPDEQPDSRLLLVTIDRSDMAAQKARGEKLIGSLSKESLSQLLEKLEQAHPRAVGLDIYRDGEQPKALITQLQKQANLFTICKANYDQGQVSGINPPVGAPRERTGFSDFVIDNDNILRRHLLAFKPDSSSPCIAEISFSLRLASQYLKQEKIVYKQPITPENGYCQALQFSNGVSFQNFRPYTGGYQGEQNYGGCQVLLNYRSHQQVAEQVTLEQVLKGTVPAEKFEDRIILIGVAHRDFVLDYWSTPYGARDDQQIPGVTAQALMVSQILSAVLRERPLIWVWPQWGEVLWIWLWSLIGGILGRQLRLLHHLAMAQGGLLISLFGLCLTIFQLQSGWLPLIPPGLVLVSTGVGVWWLTLRFMIASQIGKRQ